MAFNRKDSYYQQAKREGKRSRAAYKIEELDQRFKVFKKGQKILELGAAPGGWMEYIAQRVGVSGIVLGLDLLAIAQLPSPPCKTLIADILDPTTGDRIDALLPPPLDGAVSDLAPNLTGIKATDQANSIAILEKALLLVKERLAPGGFFICKVFQGDELKSFQLQLKSCFSQVTLAKPKSSRRTSAEIYLVATGYDGSSKRQ
ncbi:MAG: RlmE family RNA methyltransferase [Deltaproteobacteria bacterium]|nr:RlmE family RNA methyltransferase [Deltaproteobacteria bacterium]